MPSPAIELKNITKEFRIPHERRSSFRELFLNFGRRIHYDYFQVLSDIFVTVHKGECVGIIGSNGSGKSTMLKIIAEIYEPDQGTVAVHGKVIPFLELGVGFHPELSGRDNIFLNGVILGMPRRIIKKKFDAIVDFAGIRPFLDQKLKNFSQGMQIRLAFSIAIQSSGDIYLLDEILAVGDLEFQQKAYAAFHDLRKTEKTILLVSHNLEHIRTWCDRVILLEHGRIQMIGKPEEVITAYITYGKKN